MGGIGGLCGPGLPPIPRPAWVRPPAAAAEDVIGDLADLSLALGGSPTSWTMELLRLLAKSDEERLNVLAAAVPWHVHAYRWWRRHPDSPVGELLDELDRVEGAARG